MIKNSLSIILEKILKVAHQLRLKIVLMGGIATSFYTQPRATFDIDGIISLDEGKINSLLKRLEGLGFILDRKKTIKFIEGLPLITLYHPLYKIYVDFFLAKNEFQHEIVRRAKKIKVGAGSLFIISCEDLILLKLKVQREKDLEDVRQIILENRKRLDWRYLYQWAKRLGVEVFLKDELRSLRLSFPKESKGKGND